MKEKLPGRVFLISEPSVKKARAAGGSLPNITPLYAHGPIVMLLSSADPRPISQPQRALQLIEERLQTFDPSRDMLAWAGGDTIAAMLTGVALERMEINEVTWLRYDRAVAGDGSRTDDGASYTPIQVQLYDHSQDHGA